MKKIKKILFIITLFFLSTTIFTLSYCQEIQEIDDTPLAPKDYRRPVNFKPFDYKYSQKGLMVDFSEDMMKKAALQYQKVTDVNERGKWKPTLRSIDSHQTPEWFQDAKFGMFINWGLWSIGGWAPKKESGAMYPDWYEYRIYTDSIFIRYNEKNWGKDFQPDDLISLFTATDYQPEKLIELAYDAGIKYVIPFCKHHSGYSLWSTSFSHRNSNMMGPGKDLIKPLVESCNAHGLKFGFYFSLEEWEYPLIDNMGNLVNRKWGGKIEPYSKDLEKKTSGKIPVKNFIEDYIVPQATEFIDKYDPDILWYDGEWDTNVKDLKSYEISAYFYNNAEGRKEVAVNDRYGLVTDCPYYEALGGASKIGRNWLRFKSGDYFTSEFHDHGIKEHKRPWEECRSISQSFGFNWQDTDKSVISSEEFIEMFIDIVSNGGNLLLIVNLDAQGALPEVQAKRLKDIGEWLMINGEGIYGTRTHSTISEGEIRYTRSKDYQKIYAISTRWPGKQLKLKSVVPKEESKIYMLGYEKPLSWIFDRSEGLIINLPDELQEESNRPCRYAYTFSFESN